MAAGSSLAKISKLIAFNCSVFFILREALLFFFFFFFFSNTTSNTTRLQQETNLGTEDDAVPTSGMKRHFSDILKDLNKKLPQSPRQLPERSLWLLRQIPPLVPCGHILNRIQNLHPPEWPGDVRSITYSADGKSVSVVFRVTLYGTDAKIFRKSTGTASICVTSYADPVQKAEALAFRRVCASDWGFIFIMKTWFSAVVSRPHGNICY